MTLLRRIFSKHRIEIFVRHCHFSAVSQYKNRFPFFTRQACHDNLMRTIEGEDVRVTFLLDAYHPSEDTHFVKRQTKHSVIEVKEGTETGSFLRLLEHVSALKLHPETIVYFLEDDYFHKPGWVSILREGFTLDIDYVTLYDHKDKYFLPMYEKLESKIYHTASCHWRTTPSTTNTYAMRFKTLKRDLDIHHAFSFGRTVSGDHEKFCALGEKGYTLISSIPGWSTHAEPAFASPCIDWESVLRFKNS